MITSFLADILIDPVDKTPLELNAEENVLKSKKQDYEIIENVPVLTAPLSYATVTNSPLHKKQESQFSYLDHYEKDAHFFNYFEGDESFTTAQERKRSRQMIISEVPRSCDTILDVGCGGAWVAQHFLPLQKKVVSMDISKTNPIKALQNLPHPNHSAVVADVFKMPFKENTFDIIIASEVIEHVFDPTLFVEKLLEVLKPGGKLILITPYNEKIVYHLCVHCNKPTPANAHLHSFNEKNISEYLGTVSGNLTTVAFSNKLLVKVRFYAALYFLPFKAWLFIDKVFNRLFNKRSIFLVTIVKA